MIYSYDSGNSEFLNKIAKSKQGLNLLSYFDLEGKTMNTHNLLDTIAIPGGNKHSKRVR